MSETLQQRCGSFCSPDDVYLHKVSAIHTFIYSIQVVENGAQAADNLRKARDQPSEKKELLHEALQSVSLHGLQRKL